MLTKHRNKHFPNAPYLLSLGAMLFVCTDLHQISPKPSRAEPATLGWKPLDHFTDNNLGNLFFFFFLILQTTADRSCEPGSHRESGISFMLCHTAFNPNISVARKKEKKNALHFTSYFNLFANSQKLYFKAEWDQKKRTSRTFARADGVLCASEIGNKWLTKSRETDTAALCQHTPGD